MLDNLSIFKEVYKRYLKYLYVEVFKEDKIAFNKTYKKLNDNTIIFRAIEFLEREHNVPVLEALIYYSYPYNKSPVKDQLKHMLVKEFKRIENKIECNYIPF
tara:strand:- start:48312 stop:48617 length:306 start_codon:yes stop_codon:yes gene_type:complete